MASSFTSVIIPPPAPAPSNNPLPVTPVGWQVLVKLKPFEEKKGSIVIPKAQGEMHNRAALFGQVLAMGPDCFRQKVAGGDNKWSVASCKVGDWVMFQAYTGTPFKHDGQEHRLMEDECVMAIVDYSRIEELERV